MYTRLEEIKLKLSFAQIYYWLRSAKPHYSGSTIIHVSINVKKIAGYIEETAANIYLRVQD